MQELKPRSSPVIAHGTVIEPNKHPPAHSAYSLFILIQNQKYFEKDQILQLERSTGLIFFVRSFLGWPEHFVRTTAVIQNECLTLVEFCLHPPFPAFLHA
jgi:hypothetical protein